MTVKLDEHWPKAIFQETKDGILLAMPDGSTRLAMKKSKAAIPDISEGELADSVMAPAVDKKP